MRLSIFSHSWGRKVGQFRTPRHVIDFIVEIVNPQKNETILDQPVVQQDFDFIFKHILKQNTEKTIGDKLNAKERKQVGDNLVGYDISPDMTRISLVNMYLHQFASPQIHEYDTLSSEDRWNEYFDANPPFMTPKGEYNHTQDLEFNQTEQKFSSLITSWNILNPMVVQASLFKRELFSRQVMLTKL